MLLSILVCGKNDNYAADSNGRGGVCKRLELTLNKMIDNLRRLGKDDIEVKIFGFYLNFADLIQYNCQPHRRPLDVQS